MELLEPILPQATNVIHSSDIALVGGISISILPYIGMCISDLIAVFWDDERISATVPRNGESDFPVIVLIPEKLTPVGQHTVYYEVENTVGLASFSEPITITVD